MALSLVPRQISDATASAGTSKVELRFYDKQSSPVSIHPVGIEDFVALAMPVVES